MEPASITGGVRLRDRAYAAAARPTASAKNDDGQRLMTDDGPVHAQHLDVFLTGVLLAGAAGVDPQPHPAPPADFTSASRTQHASVPVGAVPPQHAVFVSVAAGDAVRSAAGEVVVFVSAMSIISGSW
jgi:hypothetical protein